MNVFSRVSCVLLLCLVHNGSSSNGYSNIDCYYETVRHHNLNQTLKINTKLIICKPGYVRLPETVFDDRDEGEVEDRDADNIIVYCCPEDVDPEERG